MLKKSYKISIFNEVYSFVSDEKEEDLLAAAQLLDDSIKEIIDKSPNTDPNRVAVLVALRLASKLVATDEIMDIFNNKIDQLINKELL